MRVKLGELTKIQTGKLDANASSPDGEYPFFTCSKETSRIATYSYDCECVLVAGNGDLNVKYYSGKFDAYQRTYIIENNSDGKLFIPYLYYFMCRYVEELRRQAVGGVIKYIKLGNLTEALIELPDIEMQKQIVTILERVEKVINEFKELKNRLDDLVQYRFVEMFGDPVANSKGWEQFPLYEVTEKIGSGATLRGGKESYQSEGITLIRSMNVYDRYFEYKELAHITDQQAKQLDNVAVKENDVFINITGASIARSCIVPKGILPARVNQHVSIIRCITRRLNPVFANNMFVNNSFKRKLLAIGEANGATRQAITKQQLETILVIMPPLKLQNQFATFVHQIDKSKVSIQKALDKTQTLLDSLMQQYFG